MDSFMDGCVVVAVAKAVAVAEAVAVSVAVACGRRQNAPNPFPKIEKYGISGYRGEIPSILPSWAPRGPGPLFPFRGAQWPLSMAFFGGPGPSPLRCGNA